MTYNQRDNLVNDVRDEERAEMETRSLAESVAALQRISADQEVAIKTLCRRMNIMDPFIRVAENDRWRALDEFYKRKTNEAQDTLCEGTQVDDDLITEGATVTRDGNILADTRLIRNKLESGTTTDTMEYRQVFTDLYGISIDDADKYIAHPQLVCIMNIRASLCIDVRYVPTKPEDLLVERIDP
ncbi:hypothetical protein LTS18_005231 [Coniosporium uncinatum]|uniref:Uncharacterized protein n=1 Tax=Coniosporium uncinatum TaxID=93489 RepID=A0ACC3DRY1_9PEZI|nr:hypothetical protein LTS18_005231 [Coniosporium uncinatum]